MGSIASTGLWVSAPFLRAELKSPASMVIVVATVLVLLPARSSESRKRSTSPGVIDATDAARRRSGNQARKDSIVSRYLASVLAAVLPSLASSQSLQTASKFSPASPVPVESRSRLLKSSVEILKLAGQSVISFMSSKRLGALAGLRGRAPACRAARCLRETTASAFLLSVMLVVF